MSIDRPAWQADGSCFLTGNPQMHTNFFDFDGNEDLARKLCADCVVREECLEYALSTNQSAGIWGGLDAGERLKAKRKKIVLQKRFVSGIVNPHKRQ